MAKTRFSPSRWWKSFQDPAAKIDRVVTDRSTRLVLGAAIDQDFETIQVTLAMTRGHGKFLRIEHVVGEQSNLSDHISEQWLDFNSQRRNEVPLRSVRQMMDDLAEVQAPLFERVKCHAGKYVDRVLIASLTEPGLWLSDFDGKRIYCGLTDAHQLAARTGLTIVDHFPADDVAVGGRGGPLEGLPLWLILADRNPQVADENRYVVSVDKSCTGYWLPASDGRDSILPEILPRYAPGIDFIKQLATSNHIDINRWPDFHSLADNLPLTSAIGAAWRSGLQRYQDPASDRTEIESEMIAAAKAACRNHNGDGFALLHSAIDCIAGEFRQHLQQQQTIANEIIAAEEIPLDQPRPAPITNPCYVIGPEPYSNWLMDALDGQLPDTEIMTDWPANINATNVRGLIAAVLGVLHIDQMQANLPWITSANQQKVLGRLTPGTPSNWRQLIRDMADYQPPAMKLKDAV